MTGPERARRADLERLANESWPLLVVGGGIVGCGTLLDATSRGIAAALIEQDDIAAGTSSRSSRLIHGGLRYLEHYQFRLVREALRERSRLLRLAPHLVRLEPFLFPVYGWPLVHRAFYGSGLVLYDLLGAARDGGRAHHLGAGAVARVAPSIRRRGLRGGIVYHDGIEDDARVALTVLRTAQAKGAVALTRVRATGLLTDASGRVQGVQAEDRETATPLDIRATTVIDATGVWAGRSDSPLGDEGMPLRPSRGSHLVVPRDRIPLEMGVTLRVPGRVLFLVPWPGHWLIGTTDEPDDGPPARPSPTGHEVEAILGAVNATFDVDLGRDDVVGAFTGLRPLVSGERSGDTVTVSREHRVSRGTNGLTRVSGGKYTTYRVMARDAVDAATDAGPSVPSRTAELQLAGAAPPLDLERLTGRLERDTGLDRAIVAALVARHGTDAAAISELGGELDLLRPLGAGPCLEAEVAWAARAEIARSLDDVLSRRLRLSMVLPDRGAAIAPRVDELLCAELGWDPDGRERRVADYLAGARREYDLPAA